VPPRRRHAPAGPHWQLGERRGTTVVVIGRNLRPESLKASWAADILGDSSAAVVEDA
jgi:hypothetical protein